ncbi:hypothetical protein CHO01_03570 [Cellulomonas hominis]|uniref:Acyl dehydratase n=1 Tax=Cellulomonas hominis TaxID=156981 RepID=A0A511F7G4_9CELL|nr:MaoC/PaaZ C-terminal domain-containing protein [Cellulomonas hominis]MBB5473477.1 acyl dehydratase [Cellulomonas hominis]GEL45241.1 hypothetical protein CHO01_03570 [Cellulomonas hominis]
MTALATGTRREVVLDAAPRLGALYARAGASAVRGRSSARGVAVLPEVEHRLDGVAPDPAQLTAYQHHVGEPAADVLPAGYVHVLAFPLAVALMVRPDFPLPALGMVHLANRVVQRSPLGVGDALDLRAWAQDLRPHRRGARVDLVTEARPAGAPVDAPPAWRGVSTYLTVGSRAAGAAPEEEPRPPFVPPVPTGRWVLGPATGRRYAAVSGDANPIHQSPLTAKALGFPRAIAHGMDTAARALAAVGARRRAAYAWDVEFAAPVLLPSSPSVRTERGETGWTVTAWDARRGKLHLTSQVRPLP